MPVSAAPTVLVHNDTAQVPTRIEGFLRSVTASEWYVENTRVLVGSNTAIEERRGQAEVGAWVAVWGDMTSATLTANVVHVLRPKGSNAPQLQFTGVVKKYSSDMAMISGTEVYFSEKTVKPDLLPLFSLARVTGYRQNNGVFATRIEILATDAENVPVNIEGAVEQIIDTRIVVAGRTITLRPQDVGRFQQGDWVQVRALVAGDGTLVADVIKTVDRSLDARLTAYVASISGLGEDNQTWDVVTFEGGHVATRRVLVATDTYVDEDRASMQADIEATIDGSKLNSVDVKAEMIWLDEPDAVERVGKLTEAAGDGLWSIDGQPVYFPSAAAAESAYAANVAPEGGAAVVVSGLRLSNGVLIGKTVRPATAADLARLAVSEDTAAATSSINWVGPTSVVTPVDATVAPTLVFGADRTAHLVYESNGYIYYMARPNGQSWSAPRRLARGAAPTAVIDAAGALHVAYVNTFLGNADIFHISLTRGVWSLASQISATTGVSADPALTADDSGGLYVAWSDNTAGGWMIHTGQFDGTYWTSYPVPNARGGSPGVAVLRGGNLFLAWHDRVPTATDAFGTLNIYGAERTGGTWDLPVNISDNARFSPGAESRDVSVVAAADNNAHVAWVDDDRQPRYDFGRGLYWPPPVNLGPRQTAAKSLTLQVGADNYLRATWDDTLSPLTTSAPIGAQTWAAAERVPGLNGKTYGASLALVGDGMAVVWLQDDSQSAKTIYEARYGLANTLLKFWAPLLSR